MQYPALTATVSDLLWKPLYHLSDASSESLSLSDRGSAAFARRVPPRVKANYKSCHRNWFCKVQFKILCQIKVLNFAVNAIKNFSRFIDENVLFGIAH